MVTRPASACRKHETSAATMPVRRWAPEGELLPVARLDDFGVQDGFEPTARHPIFMGFLVLPALKDRFKPALST